MGIHPITRCQVLEGTARAERCGRVMRCLPVPDNNLCWNLDPVFFPSFLPLLLRGRRILLRMQTCQPLGLSTGSTRSRTKNSATNLPRNHELLLVCCLSLSRDNAKRAVLSGPTPSTIFLARPGVCRARASMARSGVLCMGRRFGPMGGHGTVRLANRRYSTAIRPLCSIS
jgi:hypothetical protein